jgi:hypothetical protein
MKNKLLLLSAMISASLLVTAEEVEVKEEIKVMVEKNDDGNVSKKVIMNGKELSAEEIKELEESGKINVLHIDEDLHGEHDGEMKKNIVIETQDEDSDAKHVKVIKKHLGDKHKWISKDGEDIDVDVQISKDGKKTIEKIIINGKELSAEEIKEMKANGELKVLHLDKDLNDKHRNKMIFIGDDKDAQHGKHLKIIKKNLAEDDTENVWFSNDGGDEIHKQIEITRDDEGNETIVVDGKELSAEEVKEFKDSGQMKMLDMEVHKLGEGQAKMVVVDIDTDENMGLHEFKVFKNSKGEDGKHMVKRFVMSDEKDDPNRGRLGFMANVEDDGWHVISVVDESGAKQAGIVKGDIIIKIGEEDLTSKDTESKSMKLHTNKVGEKVKVKLKRDDKILDVIVEAKALTSEGSKTQEFEWVSEFDGDFNYSDLESKMVFINKSGDFKLNEDDIHITFPESLKDMNIFISDGKSTSKLLGKHHKFTSMSDDLAEYFDTKGGVLVLSVETDNVFGLKDGDVVKSVNDNEVESPKAIIKELLKAEEQKKITLKVVRHKKNKTLKAKL